MSQRLKSPKYSPPVGNCEATKSPQYIPTLPWGSYPYPSLGSYYAELGSNSRKYILPVGNSEAMQLPQYSPTSPGGSYPDPSMESLYAELELKQRQMTEYRVLVMQLQQQKKLLQNAWRQTYTAYPNVNSDVNRKTQIIESNDTRQRDLDVKIRQANTTILDLQTQIDGLVQSLQ